MEQPTWSDLPIMVFGMCGFGLGLVALAQLICAGQRCSDSVTWSVTAATILAVGGSQLLYLEWWRKRRRQAIAVTLIGYAVAIVAVVALLA